MVFQYEKHTCADLNSMRLGENFLLCFFSTSSERKKGAPRKTLEKRGDYSHFSFFILARIYALVFHCSTWRS